MKKLIIYKSEIIEYLYIFMLVIYAGGATVFVGSINTWKNIFGLLLPIIFTVYLAYKKKVIVSKRILFLFAGFFLYFILLTIKFRELHLRHLFIYLISFYITYVTISIYRLRFYLIYMNILYFLCIISLIFWTVHQILPDQLSNILNTISFLETANSNIQSNIIVFTLNSPYGLEFGKINIGGLSFYRNAGFAWEPGAFAVYITLAMFINLAINRFRLIGNRKFWLFFITLVTTFSSTGYAIFMVVLLFYLYNREIRYKIILFPLSILAGFYIITLPFMGEKIVEASNDNIEQMIESSVIRGVRFAPQRINSFRIDFQDFKNNPILGYGGHQEEKWTNKIGAEIATVSGMGKLLAKSGLFGTIFFLICLIQSSKMFKSVFRFNGWVFIFMIILITSISYSIIEGPLLMCFWMFSFFYPKPKPSIIDNKNLTSSFKNNSII